MTSFASSVSILAFAGGYGSALEGEAEKVRELHNCCITIETLRKDMQEGERMSREGAKAGCVRYTFQWQLMTDAVPGTRE